MGNELLDHDGRKYECEDKYTYFHIPNDTYVNLGDSSLPTYLCAKIIKIFFDMGIEDHDLHKQVPNGELTYNENCNYEVGYLSKQNGFHKDTQISSFIDDSAIKKACDNKIVSDFVDVKLQV